MACAPADSELVLKDAVIRPPAEVRLTGLPKELPSTANWIAPVGVPAPGARMLMLAVKVMTRPNTTGLADDVTATLVTALLIAWPLVKVPVPPAKLLSP